MYIPSISLQVNFLPQTLQIPEQSTSRRSTVTIPPSLRPRLRLSSLAIRLVQGAPSILDDIRQAIHEPIPGFFLRRCIPHSRQRPKSFNAAVGSVQSGVSSALAIE